MARFVLGAAMLATLFARCASTAHADPAPSEDVVREAERAGVDPVDLQGALNSEVEAGHDVGPCEYLYFTGEVAGCIGTPLVIEQPPPVSSVWDRVAQCESSGRWNTNTGNGYFGGLQEDMTFWRNHGGPAFASRPDLASKSAQIVVAERGLATQGWRAWPVCSRRLGLR